MAVSQLEELPIIPVLSAGARPPSEAELPACQLLPRVPILPEAQRCPRGAFALWLFLAGDFFFNTLCSLSNLSFCHEDLGVPREWRFLQVKKGTDLEGL